PPGLPEIPCPSPKPHPPATWLILRSADALKGSHDVQRERDESIVIHVRQLALGLRPDVLIGIEFRRVTRKAVHFHAWMSLEKDPTLPPPVNFPAIPQQDERSPEMAEQLPEESDDLGTRNVAQVKIEVQSEALTERSHRERRDDRDFVTPVAMRQVR